LALSMCTPTEVTESKVPASEAPLAAPHGAACCAVLKKISICFVVGRRHACQSWSFSEDIP
jgi:hypothetical protein